jgi:hypothetical protein
MASKCLSLHAHGNHFWGSTQVKPWGLEPLFFFKLLRWLNCTAKLVIFVLQGLQLSLMSVYTSSSYLQHPCSALATPALLQHVRNILVLGLCNWRPLVQDPLPWMSTMTNLLPTIFCAPFKRSISHTEQLPSPLSVLFPYSTLFLHGIHHCLIYYLLACSLSPCSNAGPSPAETLAPRSLLCP